MKKTIAAVMCMMSVMLVGCGSGLPDMSESEMEAIGEYAAFTLLKYDANSRSRLVDLTEAEESASEDQVQGMPEESIVVPEENESASEESTPTVEVPTDDISEPENTCDSMEAFFELPEGMSVSCSGYDLCESYHEADNTYFVLDATAGKKLLVLQFGISNNTTEEQAVNFLSREDIYRITVNGTYTRTALMTMLSNDMSTYTGTIKGGECVETVLLIEVDSIEAENLHSITLNLKNESKTHTIQVL